MEGLQINEQLERLPYLKRVDSSRFIGSWWGLAEIAVRVQAASQRHAI